MTRSELTAEQDAALKAVDRWLKDPDARQWFYLAGYAGVGKTFLAKRFAESVSGRVLYGAFTGKAAQVMRTMGCTGATTIHSMIYSARNDDGITNFVLNKDSPVEGAALVIIDEVSMVGEELARDLLSFGARILVLGDPAQLPPVQGQAYFTSGEPDVMLTEIHRQAAENPIIRLSMDVREGRGLSHGVYGESKVVSRQAFDGEDARSADQILVGLNRTRTRYNTRMREILGFSDPMPQVGDRLVCLRNRHAKGLYNGSLWSVHAVKKALRSGIKLHVRSADAEATNVRIAVNAHRFPFEGRANEIPVSERHDYDQFDYGYALTVHKAQGSQWDTVCLFDESFAFRDDRARHLYTAITRAAERITVVAG
ncbi:ATP-dependent RecD-like DNA helicase [Acuticoccus sp. M5D2P5]|uniref:ATP-dependent DNA helicase n=1 Tax=Acuticoccus kalidii TaxID=2910977 RepID=UPI001F45B958|nr:ATP-dependent RecD-like DNA helicase [Acuticoccus kalidii]MCF3934728.1 ATP-dependent RecD-like DNA helicase [Acuticoccus kalidii]